MEQLRSLRLGTKDKEQCSICNVSLLLGYK